MRRVAILGSTGSIGCSALSVAEAHRDRIEVVALVGGRNAARLAEQVRAHRPRVYGLAGDAGSGALDTLLPAGSVPGERLAGSDALVAAATHPDVDVVLCASSGTAGLEAALAAIDAGKTLALANKEVLVMAGGLMVEAARRRGVAILPVDSEHNAIHQCLHGRPAAEVHRLILTASGGPFRALDREALDRVTPEAALRHPTWQMGRKITIDSATLMNKGLEVVEARWLFDQPAEAIDVVVHPQSVVHSMVEFRDGSILAQLGVTDMRLPIQYAFSYPERWTTPVPRLDLAALGTLEFHAPDRERFPCLDLAYQALREGRAWPIVLNAANEVAVAAFLEGRLSFGGIPRLIARALDRADRETAAPRSIADVRAADLWARTFAAETLGTLPSS